ncbi:MAG: (2Fe-2S)-binding protein [Acidimicrobiales bacterium]
MTVNGTERVVRCETRTLLSDALRSHLGLTGTHVGCEQGSCGACTVIVDGRAQRSCLILAVQARGAVVETIEGVVGEPQSRRDEGKVVDHPVQIAMHEEHGVQCGFCTPGIVMSLVAAHRQGLDADSAKREVLDGHICRCTGYVNIRRAIDAAWHETGPRE